MDRVTPAESSPPAHQALFEMRWTPVDAPATTAPVRRERVLILAGDEDLGECLRWASERAGIEPTVVSWDRIELDDELVLDEQFRAGRGDEIWLALGQPRLSGRRLAPADLDDLLRRGPGMLAACVRSLAGLARPGRATPRVRVLSVGACPAEGAPELCGALQAPAWGLARAIRAEHPQLDLAMFDLDPHAALDSAALAFISASDRPDAEPELALRGDRRLAPRLIAARPGPDPRPKLELDPEAAYLVVGGLGPLGRELGRGLVERGARRLVLAGLRSLASEELGREFIDELELAGVSVELARLDIRDREAVVALRRAREQAGRPAIRGMVHAAMTDDAGVLATLDPRDIGDRIAVDFAGSWNLQSVFGHLDPLLICTSATSLIPQLAHGHGCQAAGQAFVHALAAALRGLGGAASAVAFGPWHQRPRLDPLRRRAVSAGMGVVDRALAGPAIDAALLGGHAELACVPLDLDRASALGDRPPRLLATLVDDRAPDPRPPSSLVSLAPGEGRPLFVLHPLSGETSCYAALVDRLATTREIVGLRSPALVGDEARLPDELDQLARDCRQRARTRQASGPLDLLGWGFGGALAFEMTRQELDEGQMSGLLVMVETEVPDPSTAARRPDPELDELDELVAFLADLAQLDPGDRRNLAAQVELEHMAPSCRVDLAFNLARATKLVPESLARRDFGRRVEVFAAHRRILQRWRPRTLDASVCHFARADESARAWLPRVAELSVHPLPGGFHGISTGAGAGAIAEVLRGLLE